LLRRLCHEDRFRFTEDDVEQLVLWILVGTVIGARVIFCFVYDPRELMANPFYLFQVYRGGLSFHGGLIGTIVSAYLFSRRYRIPFWNLTDALALATPTGLAMGRIGNFINGELYGRVTQVPWGMVFQEGGPQPRHPSQLYEFFLEGVVLFSVLWISKRYVRRDGILSMIFLFGYTLSRFIVEFFREPDIQVGYLFFGLTMGQLLSIVMLIAAIVTAWWLHSHPPAAIPAPGKKRKGKH
jgi:phosphatidylglycerol:prolipoprotein diacylglycerol transferase